MTPEKTTMNQGKFRKLATPGAILIAGVALGAAFSDALGPADAHAQPAESPFNATEQRKQIIQQLSQVNERLTKIETKLNSGISVKVTEMPPVMVKESGK